MLAEMRLAKRFLGIKFGYGEHLMDGIYAIPTKTSKGNAFMKMQIKNENIAGDDNYMLFWDEQLTVSWYDAPKPDSVVESEFSKLFRQIEELA